MWWTCDVKDLLPDDVIKEYELDTKVVTKGEVRFMLVLISNIHVYLNVQL